MRVMSDAEFCFALAAEYEREAIPSQEDRLIQDLGFDSVDMLNLIPFIEQTARHMVPSGMSFPMIETVRDAYHFMIGLAELTED